VHDRRRVQNGRAIKTKQGRGANFVGSSVGEMKKNGDDLPANVISQGEFVGAASPGQLKTKKENARVNQLKENRGGAFVFGKKVGSAEGTLSPPDYLLGAGSHESCSPQPLPKYDELQ